MLRINPIEQTLEEAVLRIEGRLAGSDVNLLEQELEQQVQKVKRLVLELQGIRHIDRDGLAMLERWTGEGLELRGSTTTFVRALLKTRGLA